MATLLSFALPFLGCALMMFVCMGAMSLMGRGRKHDDAPPATLDDVERAAPDDWARS